MTATATKPNPSAALERTAPRDVARTEESFVPVLSAVIWLGCLLVGGLGFLLPYARPQPPAPLLPPVEARLIKVDLAPDASPAPAKDILPPPNSMPPPLFTPAMPPQAPPLVAVAQPSLAIAFALPIEAPARVVEARQAGFTRPAPNPAPPNSATGTGTGQPQGNPPIALPVQRLTFGQGEGNQPAPRYPDAARRAGQEGTVAIRFSVGSDGQVLAAEPSSASPWSALNREALRVVREQWRFPPGSVRLYEVTIRFELRK